MRILLIEDNRELATWLARLLRRDQYVVDCVHDGEEAEAALLTQAYALVILDLGLPGLSGFELLRRFRARDAETPVLILTADDRIESRVTGLDRGADDYLVKPFEAAELEARIRAQLRRRHHNRMPELACGPLSFDTNSRAFALKGSVLALTPREHAMLEELIRNAGKPVPKEKLADALFGFDSDASPNAVEIHVHRLRKKLEGHGVAIATLRGLGYVLKQDDAR